MARKNHGRQISGIIVLDKALGDTSNRCLQQVKHLLNAAKAGHTGSLDPLATGVLPLCFGEATKVSQFLLDSDKAYEATIKLGVQTASGDAEGEILATADTAHISKADVEKALESFRGEIQQTPSMFSAIKHEGQPLYKLARAGKTVERKVRTVMIYELTLLEFNNPDVLIHVKCSKGTYIRSIAEDLGELLQVGGHITALRRTQAGPFTLEQSATFEELEALHCGDDYSSLDARLIAPDKAITEIPPVDMPAATADFMKLGQAVLVQHLPVSGLVRLYSDGEFFGIGEILDDGRVKPHRLMSTA